MIRKKWMPVFPKRSYSIKKHDPEKVDIGFSEKIMLNQKA